MAKEKEEQEEGILRGHKGEKGEEDVDKGEEDEEDEEDQEGEEGESGLERENDEVISTASIQLNNRPASK